MHKHAIPLEQVEATTEQIRQALPPDDQIDFISGTFHAMSDPIRCKILLALTRSELCVTELAEIAGVSISRISHHLKGLRDTHLVKFRREGNTIYYSMDDAHVGNLFVEAISHFEHIYQALPDHSLILVSN